MPLGATPEPFIIAEGGCVALFDNYPPPPNTNLVSPPDHLRPGQILATCATRCWDGGAV